MPPNFFSLTNLLLSTSLLFALTAAAPIGSNVVNPRPNYSPLDHLRIGTTVLPIAKPRIGVVALNKTPILAPISPDPIVRLTPKSETWVEETFDPEASVQKSKRDSMVVHHELSKTPDLLMPPTRIGTVDLEGPPSLRVDMPAGVFSKKADELEERDVEEVEEPEVDSVEAREPKGTIDYVPIGPTRTYSGSLWARSLKRCDGLTRRDDLTERCE